MNKFILIATLLTLVGCTGSHVIPQAAKPVAPPNNKPTNDGTPLSPETYLRKLSLHIRGVTPTSQDYADLAAAVKGGASDQFIREKLDAYLASDEHIDKMTARLEELFFLKPSDLPSNGPPIDDADIPFNDRPDDYTIHNSLNQLFRDVAARNMSWDTLLTGRNYIAFPLRGSIAGDLSDSLFFASAAGTPKTVLNPTPVVFDQDDARVAGSLTTSRFFNRYGNTALNKNRRRAAAVFRIFLCDDMKAVVVDEAGNQDGILDKVFPSKAPGGSASGGGFSGGSDRHGTDPACMKCHSKLDPLGLTFQASGLVLSPFASAGALVYPREDGSTLNVHAQGIGDLAHSITQQREYARCQVQHFWDWFIGVDVPLDEATMNELTAKFDQVDRKTNDFITYLVNRPEFGSFSQKSPEQEMAARVKGVLQNCNGCHAAAKKGIPSFTDWPIGGDSQHHAKWLGKIQRALALDGSGKPRSMPPQSSAWQPDAAELELLKRWFDLGSPGLAAMGGAHEVR